MESGEGQDPFAFDQQTGNLLEEVEHIFSFSERREKEVMHHFGNGAKIATGKNAQFQIAQENQLFSEKQLKNTCVRYRLRLLNSKLYGGEVPYEVVSAIKSYEHRHPDKEIQFHILAPSAFFLQEDEYKSPLLFAAHGNESFEMICQWGKKRPFYSEFLRYPFRDIKSLVISSLITGFTIAVVTGLLGLANGDTFFKSILYKVPLLVLTSGGFSTGALIYGLVTQTDFSSDNWNKEYFNRSSR
jgi:hypothetical protein